MTECVSDWFGLSHRDLVTTLEPPQHDEGLPAKVTNVNLVSSHVTGPMRVGQGGLPTVIRMAEGVMTSSMDPNSRQCFAKGVADLMLFTFNDIGYDEHLAIQEAFLSGGEGDYGAGHHLEEGDSYRMCCILLRAMIVTDEGENGQRIGGLSDVTAHVAIKL